MWMYESMGKPYSCIQFIKSRVFHCKSLTLHLNVQWSKVHMIKLLSPWYQAMPSKISLVCCRWRCYSCCALITIQTATNLWYSFMLHTMVIIVISECTDGNLSSRVELFPPFGDTEWIDSTGPSQLQWSPPDCSTSTESWGKPRPTGWGKNGSVSRKAKSQTKRSRHSTDPNIQRYNLRYRYNYCQKSFWDTLPGQDNRDWKCITWSSRLLHDYYDHSHIIEIMHFGQ